MYGSVRGVARKGHSYRDNGFSRKTAKTVPDTNGTVELKSIFATDLRRHKAVVGGGYF